MAESVGVSIKRFQAVMKKHDISLEELYLYYKKHGAKVSIRKPYYIGGQTFYSKKAIYRYIGVSEWTIEKQVRETGKTFEEICREYAKRRKVYLLDDIQFDNVNDICAYLGINRNTWYKHIRRTGDSVKTTFEYYKNKKSE
jgi:hypothetical protein